MAQTSGTTGTENGEFTAVGVDTATTRELADAVARLLQPIIDHVHQQIASIAEEQADLALASARLAAMDSTNSLVNAVRAAAQQQVGSALDSVVGEVVHSAEMTTLDPLKETLRGRVDEILATMLFPAAHEPQTAAPHGAEASQPVESVSAPTQDVPKRPRKPAGGTSSRRASQAGTEKPETKTRSTRSKADSTTEGKASPRRRTRQSPDAPAPVKAASTSRSRTGTSAARRTSEDADASARGARPGTSARSTSSRRRSTSQQ